MRIALALVLGIVIPAAVFLVSRDEPTSAASGSVTLVGDSLNVGTEPYLRDELDGWTIDGHDQVGRRTDEGIAELRALGGAVAPVVVVSLGTNDADGTEETFRALVAEAIELVGPDRCLVWATTVLGGAPREGFNQVLAEAADEHPNVRLVDWAALVEEDGTLLATDAVHGTPEGYARRANETARVVRDCPEPRS